MNETSRRLILQYNPGVFTFRNFDAMADNEQIIELAKAINAFQDAPVRQVVIETRSIMQF